MTATKNIGLWVNRSNKLIIKLTSDPIEKKWRKNLLIWKKRSLGKNELLTQIPL